MNSGFIKLYRSLKDWEFYGIPSAMMLWIHILITANWEDGSFRGEPVPRGTLISSLPHLSTDTGLSESTVRRWLKKFENAGMIEVTATNKWTRIKVLKYSTFQDIPDRQVNRQMTGQVNSQMNSPMTPNIRKEEEKEIKNIPPYIPPKGDGTSRKRRGGVRIDTPDWFKRQQSGEIPEEAPASPELIAEFEKAKKSFRKGE